LARPRVPSPRVAGPAQHLERSIDATHRLGDDVVCGQVARRVRRSAEPGADVPVLGDPLGDDGGSPFPLGLGAGDTRLLTYPRRATVAAVFGTSWRVLRRPAARSPIREKLHTRARRHHTPPTRAVSSCVARSSTLGAESCPSAREMGVERPGTGEISAASRGSSGSVTWVVSEIDKISKLARRDEHEASWWESLRPMISSSPGGEATPRPTRPAPMTSDR
jgi:hypothetical protein